MSKPETNPDDSKSVPENDSNTVPEDDSHAEPEKDLKFSKVEPIAGIIFAIIATVIFLVFPQIITVVFIGGEVIPTFDKEVIQSLWVLIPGILWGLFRIGVDVAYLVERSYTKRLAKISVIGHILTAIVTLIIFIPYRIVYWEYIDWVYDYVTPVSAGFANILAYPNVIIIVLMLVVLTIESVNVIRKGNKAEKKDEEEEETDEAVQNGGGNIEQS